MKTNRQRIKLTKQELARLRKPLLKRIVNRLTYNPRRRAHRAAREITSLIALYGNKDTRVHQRVDELLTLAMDRCNDPWDAISTLSLWLTEYKLNLFPGMMASFMPYHLKYGSLILLAGARKKPANWKDGYIFRFNTTPL